MQISYLSKTENAFQNSGWRGRKYISFSTCRLGEGAAGRSHFPGICGIKMFVWCWGMNKTAVVRAHVPTGQFGNFKLLYSSGFSPCITQIQITPYCYYEVFDLGIRKGRDLDISSCFPEEVPWCEAVLGPDTSEASFLRLLLILFSCYYLTVCECVRKNSDWNMVFAWNFSQQGWLPVWACQGLSTRKREKKA